MKPLAEESFNTCNGANKIKHTFIECSLVICFNYYFQEHYFRPFIRYDYLVLSSSERQELLFCKECFRFAGQIRFRTVHKLELN